MANALQLIGGSVPRGLESLMKVRKVTRITDIVRKENSMVDKVQKIREEVSRMQLYTQSEVLKQVLDYIDEVQKEEIPPKFPIISPKETPVCAFSTNRYTDEDRMVLCDGCEEECEYAQKEEPVSEELEKELDTYIQRTFTIDKEQLNRFGIAEKDYMYTMDKSDMLKMLSHFTNNFTTPISEDLEEAAKVYASDTLCVTNEEDWDSNAIEVLNSFKAGANWQKQIDEDENVLIYKHGFDACKEQMMENAIETRIEYDNDEHLIASTHDLTYTGLNLKYYDKVKLIIVKEE